MRVLFDLTSADRRDGVSRWSLGVVSAFAENAPDWELSAACSTRLSLPSSVEVHQIPHPRRARYLAMLGWDRRMRTLGDDFDVMVGPAFVSWRGAPEIPVIHDLAFLRFPGTLSRRNLIYLRTMVPRALRRASAVVTVSEQVAGEIVERYGLDPSMVHVVPGAADLPPGDRSALPPGLPERFFLMVGTLEPRKNIAAALRAHDRLRAEDRDTPPIVLVGGRGWRAGETEAMLEQRIDAGSVIDSDGRRRRRTSGSLRHRRRAPVPFSLRGLRASGPRGDAARVPGGV